MVDYHRPLSRSAGARGSRLVEGAASAAPFLFSARRGQQRRPGRAPSRSPWLAAGGGRRFCGAASPWAHRGRHAASSRASSALPDHGEPVERSLLRCRRSALDPERQATSDQRQPRQTASNRRRTPGISASAHSGASRPRASQPGPATPSPPARAPQPRRRGPVPGAPVPSRCCPGGWRRRPGPARPCALPG